jgi:hypothetical protein
MVTKRNPDAKQYIFKIFSPLDLAYLAGIIDGEGCFHMCTLKHNGKDGYISPHYRGILKVSNTDYSLIEWLKKTFEGTESACTRSTTSKKFERSVFDWIVTGFRLLDLCEQVRPYLIIKKKHCENMIKFKQTYPRVKTGRGNKILSKETLDIRQSCLEESRKLNTRFHLHPLKNISKD